MQPLDPFLMLLYRHRVDPTEREDKTKLRRAAAEARIIFLDVFRFFAEDKRNILGVEIQETARLPLCCGALTGAW